MFEEVSLSCDCAPREIFKRTVPQTVPQTVLLAVTVGSILESVGFNDPAAPWTSMAQVPTKMSHDSLVVHDFPSKATPLRLSLLIVVKRRHKS